MLNLICSTFQATQCFKPFAVKAQYITPILCRSIIKIVIIQKVGNINKYCSSNKCYTNYKFKILNFFEKHFKAKLQVANSVFKLPHAHYT